MVRRATERSSVYGTGREGVLRGRKSFLAAADFKGTRSTRGASLSPSFDDRVPKNTGNEIIRSNNLLVNRFYFFIII